MGERQHFKCVFIDLYFPLVVRLVHKRSQLYDNCGQLLIFLSSLGRMKTSWGLFTSLKMSCKQLTSIHCLGKRENGDQNNQKLNKEGYKMGLLQLQLYNCPVTLNKTPWQQTSVDFGKKVSEIHHFTFPCWSLSPLFVTRTFYRCWLSR